MTDDQNWQPPGGTPVPPPRYGEFAPIPPQPQSGGAPGPQPGGPYGFQPGWTPPPKPGLIPLRPLGFGTLIGAPFQVLRRNPKATFGSALLVQGIILLVTLVVTGGITALVVSRIAMADAADRDAVSTGGVVGILISALVPIVLGLVGSAFLQGVIVTEVARATLGEKLTLRTLWRMARRRLGALVLWILILAGVLLGVVVVLAGLVTLLVVSGPAGIVAGILLGVFGGLGLLVLGVWIYTKVSLVPCILVLERSTIRAAIVRSWSLTNRHFWRTFGAQFLVAVIVNVVSQIVTTPIALVYGFAATLIDPTGSGQLDTGAITTAAVSYGVLLLVSLVIGSITSVVQASTVAIVYLDLRMRKEGLDLELVRFVEARQAGDERVADPYLPANLRGAPPAGTAESGSPTA